MRRTLRSFSACALAVWAAQHAAGLAPGASQATGQEQEFVEVPGSLEFTGELIARPLQPEHAAQRGLTLAGVAARRQTALALLAGYEEVQRTPEVDEYVIRVAPASESAVAARLLASECFQFVEPNWRVFPLGCPNDALFNSQWHHIADRMNSCAGWDIATGTSATTVAICDTGLRIQHQDLLLHRKEGYNAVDQLWESQGGQVQDINGHGTMTTGCAAANGNNTSGVTGTGQNLSHRILRVSNAASGSSTIAILTHAARTAADAGDRVVSVSYSGVKSAGIDSAGAYCRSKGALLLWAAGNESQSLSGNRDDNVVVVGATTASDNKASFSNFGPFVDLMAPGEGIFTTTFNTNNSYGSASGTSFACPLAAGLCALIFDMDPTLTPAQVEDILRAGCDDLGTAGIDNTFGYGRIDVFNSLSLVDACALQKFCNPASGSPANLTTIDASDCSVAGPVVLSLAGAPQNQFTYLLIGSGNSKVTNPPGAIGDLCVVGGACLGRYSKDAGQISGAGTFALDVANTLSGGANFGIPTCGGSIQSGETWNFQFWHRNPMGAPSGFSEAIAITFEP